MFAIGIRYLCGRAVATHPAHRERPEWPPHPDRVFMALAAAHFETDGNPAERNALEWLEQQMPPALAASDALPRASVTAFVPVNDVAMPAIRSGKEPSAEQVAGGLALLPDRRPRQARQFPAAIPEDPVVHLIWPDAKIADQHRRVLAALCEKVTYVGHSGSLVQAWVADDPPAAAWVPTQGIGKHRLRITGPGRLADLAERYRLGQRPVGSLWTGYMQPRPPSASAIAEQSVFSDDLAVLRRIGGPALGLESTLQLTSALRGAIMQSCPAQPPPEWVSGHKADQTASETPHVALFPLPHVGREHADGHLLGVAIAIPRAVDAAEAARCLDGVLNHDDHDPLELRMGNLGVWQLQPEDRDEPAVALRPSTWTEASERWATVTPIVLDRHPKGPDKWKQAEDTIAAACLRIGLPRPRDVVLAPVSLYVGAPHSRRFPNIQRKSDGGNLHHTHAIITFDQPVEGPVLLGAGRYRGYGLCRPWFQGRGE